MLVSSGSSVETGHSKPGRGVALSDGCVHLLLVAASLQGQIFMQRPNHVLNSSLAAFCLSAEANYVYIGRVFTSRTVLGNGFVLVTRES